MRILNKIRRIVGSVYSVGLDGGGDESDVALSQPLKISILVLTYNRCQILERALQSIIAQSVAADEIIVIDGGSGDGTKEMVNALDNIRYVEVRERNHAGEFVGSLAHSTNEGFRLAKNDLVFLLGDDVILPTDCLDILMKDIKANPDYAAWVCPYGKTKRTLRYDVYNDLLTFNMGIISRPHYISVGKFDEQYMFYSWDKDFSLSCWQKGYRLYPSQAGIVHHASPNEMRAQIEMSPDVARCRKKFPYRTSQRISCKEYLKKLKRQEHCASLKEKASRTQFLSYEYIRHNYRRLEHLASLDLPLYDRHVLEVGAGIGDLTSYFLDRGCRVVSTDARLENVRLMQERYPAKRYTNFSASLLDLDCGRDVVQGNYDVVFCYGILYHLKSPAEAVRLIAGHCKDMLIVETCVSFGDKAVLNPLREPASSPSQAYSGVGCRPTRSWVYNELRKHFEFVYIPATQPNDEQFPIDWTNHETHEGLVRAIFIASRNRLDNPLLQEELIMRQKRH